MRGRVTKAKAFIAVKNYNAAIYELEGIRREINDPTVHSVVNVMLMNCYLEQGDYKRAQAFLNELFKAQTANKPNAAQNYLAVAAQVVKGARSQQERYKSLGLMMNDRNLTPDAIADVEKMRETVEIVITQSKAISADKKKASDAFALVEESSNARIALARDDYDAKRWKEEVADAREGLMSSRSTVLNAAGDDPVAGNGGTVASNQPVYTNSTPATTNTALRTETPPSLIPTSNQVTPKTEPKTENTTEAAQNNVRLEPVPEQQQQPVTTPEKTVAQTPKETVSEKPLTPNVNPAANTADDAPKVPTRERRVNTPNTGGSAETVAQNNNQTTKTDGDVTPLQVGSLVEYATQKVNPVYPPQAKTLRMTGVVKVEVTIDEQGQVAAVQNSTGPSLLQRAAADALRKWKFKPFTKDGQPVKANGFVNFNFNL
ncbi:MAG TPA: TonB family protein [Pyrinomonadaceae bacterium]|nr:TonB family protein [Pyrinomonadaceae bacterium]